MSVTVDWCASNIVYINFEHHWDWHEFHEGMQQAHTLIYKSPKVVHLMVDLIGSVKHVSTSTLTNIIDEVETPPNQGMIVIVTEDELLGDKIASILSQINPDTNDVNIVSSGEDAITLIHNRVRA